MQGEKIVLLFSGDQLNDRGRLTVNTEKINASIDEYIEAGNGMRNILEIG